MRNGESEEKDLKLYLVVRAKDEIFDSYGDVKDSVGAEPIWYHQKRVNLLNNLHKTNLIRTNKAMMYGGEVELRTPFINKKVINLD